MPDLTCLSLVQVRHDSLLPKVAEICRDLCISCRAAKFTARDARCTLAQLRFLASTLNARDGGAVASCREMSCGFILLK